MDASLILAVRKAGRWNQKQFAQMLGVSPITICRWEKGHVTPLPAFSARIEEIRNNLERHGKKKASRSTS